MGGKRARRRQLISDRIALYKTEEDLGAWGAGKGRWVYDEQDKEHFVFVTLDPASLPNSRARRVFKRQLERSQVLAHPRIVALLKGGTDDGDGRPYLIQEATSGRTLAQAFEKPETFTPSGARQVAVDLLNGLAYAHYRGCLEGGLSPTSVLISGEGDLTRGRILTFGFPRMVGALTQTTLGDLRVDPEYAAPEVIKGEPVDARADVYSVSALLYRMLTGKPAVSVEGVKDAVLHRLNQTAENLPEGTLPDPEEDEALRVALRRGLSKDPSRRPTARGLALLLAGQSDESERFQEVLPDGGTCSASDAKIPPLAERTWDRKASDRPFRCRTTGAAFAGQAHWDPQSLTSTKGTDTALPEPKGEAPKDVTLTVPDASKPPERDSVARRRAMHELITSSKEERPARDLPQQGEAEERSAEEEARGSDVVRTALIDAWETDRREQNTARLRAKGAEGERHSVSTSAGSARNAESSSTPTLAPLSRPPRTEPTEPTTSTATPTGWALITLALLLLALFLGISLSGERSSRVDAERDRDLAKSSMAQAAKTADENASQLDTLSRALSTLRETRDADAKTASDAEAARVAAVGAQREAEEAGTQLRSALDAMTAQAREAREALAAAQREVSDLSSRAKTQHDTETTLRAALAAAQAKAADTSQLETLKAEVARLATRVAQAGDERANLTQQLEAARGALAALQSERDEARRSRDGLQRQLAEASARTTSLTAELERAVARREIVERELSELKLSVPTGGGATPLGEALPLSLATVDANGAVTPTAGAPVSLAPGSRAVLTVDVAQLTPLLRAAETSNSILAIHVQLSGEGKAPRAFGQALKADGNLDGSQPRRYHRAAQDTADGLRFWLTPAEARRYVKEGRPLAFVLEAPFGGAPREVLKAELVSTPIAGDAARLLKELRAKSW